MSDPITFTLGLLTAVENLKTFANTALEAKKAIDIGEVKIELLAKIIDIQQSAIQLQGEYARLNGESEKLRADLKKQVEWEHKKSEFIIEEWSPEIFVYRKKDSSNTEGKLRYCVKCFGNQKIAPFTKHKPTASVYHCTNCDTQLNPNPPERQSTSRPSGYVDNWRIL